VHFAITAEERAQLEGFASDRERKLYIADVIEKRWDHRYLIETDKAWDPIHRCLGEIPPVEPGFLEKHYDQDPLHRPEDYGSYPLKLCVLGGKPIMKDHRRCGYIIRLIEPNEVIDIARALPVVTWDWMRKSYELRCMNTWPEAGEEDLNDAWDYLEGVKAFFEAMAGNGRAVIFTVDL
jgi:hypothetical protein